jgi:hypothetical protein
VFGDLECFCVFLLVPIWDVLLVPILCQCIWDAYFTGACIFCVKGCYIP